MQEISREPLLFSVPSLDERYGDLIESMQVGGGDDLVQSPNKRFRSIRKILLGAIAICGFCMVIEAQVNQVLTLPDPTPRPPDLKKIYEDDPAAKARQQQAADLRAAQQRAQVTAAANRLNELAQQLKDDMEKHEVGGPLGPNAQKAAEIEKLAKTVKNTMKSQ